MIVDSNLEFNSQWAAYTDPGIGNQPTKAIVTYATVDDPFLTVTNVGGSYANMMAATHRPVLYGFYSFSFNIFPGDWNVIQALESEASYCDQNSRYYNNSLQFNNVNPAGMIQAYASPEEPWADTGIIVPRFSVGVQVTINYYVDVVKGTMSTLSIVIGGKTYPLPSKFENIPGFIRPGWAPGLYVQFQPDLASKGGTIVNKYNNINVKWF
jgi:hypothetical protein